MADELDPEFAKQIAEKVGESLLINELFQILIERNIIGRADVVAKLDKLSTIHATPFLAPARRMIDGIRHMIEITNAEPEAQTARHD